MPVDQQPGRRARLRARAVSTGSDAVFGTRKAVLALVEAVGALVDAAIDRVLLSGERVTSAEEAKRLLAGEAGTEALAEEGQRAVGLAVPVVRILARGARFTRVPWAMVASSSVSIGITVRTGVREIQVLAALIAYRIEQATGAPAAPALVEKLAVDLYLHPRRTPTQDGDKVHL